MQLESVATIPRCAECEAHWLLADEARSQAWLTNDEPSELVFLLPGLRQAGVRRGLRITRAARCPCCAIWRRLTAELDQSPQLVQEAGAVVSQVVGDELAWKLGVR
jgi:hypothetical protein